MEDSKFAFFESIFESLSDKPISLINELAEKSYTEDKIALYEVILPYITE